MERLPQVLYQVVLSLVGCRRLASVIWDKKSYQFSLVLLESAQGWDHPEMMMRAPLLSHLFPGSQFAKRRQMANERARKGFAKWFTSYLDLCLSLQNRNRFSFAKLGEALDLSRKMYPTPGVWFDGITLTYEKRRIAHLSLRTKEATEKENDTWMMYQSPQWTKAQTQDIPFPMPQLSCDPNEISHVDLASFVTEWMKKDESKTNAIICFHLRHQTNDTEFQKDMASRFTPEETKDELAPVPIWFKVYNKDDLLEEGKKKGKRKRDMPAIGTNYVGSIPGQWKYETVWLQFWIFPHF